MTLEQRKESSRLNEKLRHIEKELIRIQAGFDGEGRPGKRRKLTRAYYSVSKKLYKVNKASYLLRKAVFYDLTKN